ncbi:lysophospholipid acyltransferase family protein [Rubinisphaera sp.]|uniref:lysophospholipid acyltransferase family protein n=1 Tax=Rubinisphaera sp. TaxID=2024857 RepID=UPI000C0FCF0E|nr:lysophospholipid acyltransferase family protein [Rubinisphaera sp.]MBV07831.1 lipid A biosynthesis acyltransferase [Rubinisphaera sp.]|tara:strand:- start:1283 stop:2242 length:960 start_codon:yes stop_codon:yes gene_type:complete
MTGKSIRYLAEYTVFRLLTAAIGCLSYRQSVLVAESIARFAFFCLPRKLTRYKVCRENLQTAFGDELDDERADRIILGMWIHLLRLIVEMIQLPRKLRRENFHECITFQDRHLAVTSLTSDRPVILLSGHFGNWEMSLVSFGLFGFRAGAVARALDNPHLHDWFRRFREQTGHYMILKSGASEEVSAEMESAGVVAMLGDQDAGPRGLFVDFFGKPASTFKSIGVLALQYDALICVGYARRLPDDFINSRWTRYEIGIEAVIDPRDEDLAGDVQAITRRYSAALEQIVLKSPEQYFWVHRRWKSEPRKRVKKTAVPKAA